MSKNTTPKPGAVATKSTVAEATAPHQDIVATAVPLASSPAPAPARVDLSKVSIVEMRAEIKRRAAEAKANALQVGQRVIIRDPKSKLVGKEGVAIVVRKVRAFVQVPGIIAPGYVLISDLERVQA